MTFIHLLVWQGILFYAAVHHGIDIVNNCAKLDLYFPSTISELKKVVKEFEEHSSFGVLNVCVGALDGWLC